MGGGAGKGSMFFLPPPDSPPTPTGSGPRPKGSISPEMAEAIKGFGTFRTCLCGKIDTVKPGISSCLSSCAPPASADGSAGGASQIAGFAPKMLDRMCAPKTPKAGGPPGAPARMA
jgi:hypothetical protein